MEEYLHRRPNYGSDSLVADAVRDMKRAFRILYAVVAPAPFLGLVAAGGVVLLPRPGLAANHLGRAVAATMVGAAILLVADLVARGLRR